MYKANKDEAIEGISVGAVPTSDHGEPGDDEGR